MTETSVHTYLIEPKAPLIIRSSRPFSETAATNPARFPPPSTVAGALRAAYARSNAQPLDLNLLERSIRGPLAAKLDTEGNLKAVLVPKPADAHYFTTAEQPHLVRASPKALAKGEGCNLPAGLLPLQFAKPVTGKPAAGPAWWRFQDLLQWRSNTTTLCWQQINRDGWTPNKEDIRTHIAVSPNTKAAEFGKLFQTSGLTMWASTPETANAETTLPETAIGLLASIDGNIKSGLLNLGGEKRLAAIQAYPNSWPQAPAELARNIQQAKGLTLTLLSPALFEYGWLPGWLDPSSLAGTPPGCSALKIKLIAAAINGWQAQSGWDLQARQPRASRKMVPAGATYWFEIINFHPQDINTLWLANVSDKPQDRRDGFGLALPYSFTP